jgi:hypothetical protein
VLSQPKLEKQKVSTLKKAGLAIKKEKNILQAAANSEQQT